MKREKSFYIAVFFLCSISSALAFWGILAMLGDSLDYMFAFILVSTVQFGFIAAFLFYLKDMIQQIRK